MQKLFVLVRSDLKGSSPAVQAGHAVAQWMLEHPRTWENETLVYLNVGSMQDLQRWIDKIYYKDLDFATFKEPDLDNEVTAVACLTDKRNIFNNLPLL